MLSCNPHDVFFKIFNQGFDWVYLCVEALLWYTFSCGIEQGDYQNQIHQSKTGVLHVNTELISSDLNTDFYSFKGHEVNVLDCVLQHLIHTEFHSSCRRRSFEQATAQTRIPFEFDGFLTFSLEAAWRYDRETKWLVQSRQRTTPVLRDIPYLTVRTAEEGYARWHLFCG